MCFNTKPASTPDYMVFNISLVLKKTNLNVLSAAAHFSYTAFLNIEPQSFNFDQCAFGNAKHALLPLIKFLENRRLCWKLFVQIQGQSLLLTHKMTN